MSPERAAWREIEQHGPERHSLFKENMILEDFTFEACSIEAFQLFNYQIRKRRGVKLSDPWIPPLDAYPPFQYGAWSVDLRDLDLEKSEANKLVMERHCCRTKA